ncbi:hypothetical protein [Streptomyces sp. NBC_00829]|uniref:hypothetical protein n=1 Tax=Streptomyces sp. NBC_00829 TaxID=2903679 RepID=UPI003862E8A3|nr:hypothetical protein OG293_00080 [Streptomyces sp. NBC_00829]WTB19097.1 hypothetical protein OG293_39455 [Streptomyces sp. NBC_00829]
MSALRSTGALLRRGAAFVLTVLTVFAGGMVAAPPAAASVSQGYFYGAGWGSGVNDDWGD